jgi:hypothetical protein
VIPLIPFLSQDKWDCRNRMTQELKEGGKDEKRR